ncbi:MAG: hypothetical protein ACREOD_10525, partial [Candidatus Dormibacteria bacterium]
YELNPSKQRGGAPHRLGALGWSGPSRGSIARRPAAISRSCSAVDSTLIERDWRITEVAVIRHSDTLVTAIHAASFPK